MKTNLSLSNIDNKSICFFIHNSSLSGAERSVIDLITLLISKNIVCTAVIPGKGPLENELGKLGVLIKNINHIPHWCSLENKYECYEEIVNVIQHDLFEIIEFIREVSPNAIYTQTIVNPFGAIVSEYLNIPHFLALREYGKFDHGLKFPFGFKKSMKAIYKSSDYIFSISKSVAEIVLEKNYSNPNVIINYSKVDVPEKYKNREFKGFKEKIKIGIFGTINEGKNQIDIIKAVLYLLNNGLNLELLIVGQHKKDEYLEYLSNFISKTDFKDKIIFVDHTIKPMDLMKNMDIIVSCSKKEALGRTLLEAILLKIPIIYSNSGGPQEIYINEEHGLAYNLYDEIDLADKIIKTIKYPEQTIYRINNAFDYVSNKFTFKTYCEPVINALNNVIKNPSKKRKSNVTNLIMSKLSINSLMKNKLGFIFLFIDEGMGFSEGKYIKFPVIRSNKPEKFIFSLSDIKNIQSLRLDPLDESCIIKVIKLSLFDKNDKEFNLIQNIFSNALIDKDNVLFFDTIDSQISFDNLSSDILKKSKYMIAEIKYIFHGKNALNKCLKTYKEEQNKFIFKLSKKNNYKIVFFGASSALEKRFNLLKEMDIIPDYICDNDKSKHGKYLRDYEIKSPDEVFEKNEDFFVLITSSYVNEIKQQIIKFENIIIISDLWGLGFE